MEKKQVVRKHLSEKKILLSVGVYDALSALVMDRAGIPSVYITGYGAAASVMGVPDIGLMSMNEMVTHVRHIAGAVGCPVVADADTGYGGSANVRRTVREYETAGADVIQLEDQEWPKRCGHMEGKRLVSADEMCRRIRVAARSRMDADTLIIARTDAIAVEGFDAALDRAKAYRDSGADILFVEAPRDLDQMSAIPRTLGCPCLANMVEGGKTPFLGIRQLQEMGFAIAIYPISGLLLAARKLGELASVFLRDGSSAGMIPEMMNFGQFNELIDVRSYMKLDEL